MPLKGETYAELAVELVRVEEPPNSLRRVRVEAALAERFPGSRVPHGGYARLAADLGLDYGTVWRIAVRAGWGSARLRRRRAMA